MIVETAASGASSARDISVKFQPRHLALRCRGLPQAIQVSCQTSAQMCSSPIGLKVTDRSHMLVQRVRGADHRRGPAECRARRRVQLAVW